jgi:dipeptidyl aminopeptidase/acylaminoacyl peptidase
MPLWERRYRAPAVSFPAWSRHVPDRLVYTSTEAGSHQAYVWDRASNVRRRASNEPIGVVDASPTADGAGVVWFHDPSGSERGRYVVAPFEGGEARPLLPDVADGWSGGVSLGRRVVAVALAEEDGFAAYVSVDGGPARELVRARNAVTIGGAWRGGFGLGGLSADESFLCVEHAEHGDMVRCALRVFRTGTGEVAGDQWDGEGLALRAAAWSPAPGDQRLAILHEREGEERPAIWDLATGERHDLALDLEGEIDVLDWWPDASALLLVARVQGRDRLVRLELEPTRLQPLAHPEGTISAGAVRPDGTVWYRVASGGTPPRVLDGAEVEILAPGGDPPPPGRPYGSWWFMNPHGQRVHGFLATPEGDPPFPAVMWVHGGPTWLHQDTWNRDVQTFVDCGFAVAMVNYRGSTGYGAAWRDALVGNIGFPEVEDILAGLDDLVARGIADASRAVIGGWSWGGYVTLLALGLHPDRFAAGVAGVPVGDYAECYRDLSPTEQAYDRYLLGGPFEEKAELVRERSPITYVDRVRAPVLCLIGDNDTRCPPRQAYLYVDALRARGGAVEVYSYDAGHSSHVVEEEVRQMRAILDFLGRTVGLAAPIAA